MCGGKKSRPGSKVKLEKESGWGKLGGWAASATSGNCSGEAGDRGVEGSNEVAQEWSGDGLKEDGRNCGGFGSGVLRRLTKESGWSTFGDGAAGVASNSCCGGGGCTGASLNRCDVSKEEEARSVSGGWSRRRGGQSD